MLVAANEATQNKKKKELTKCTFDNKSLQLVVNTTTRFEISNKQNEGMLADFLTAANKEKVDIHLDNNLVKPFGIYINYLTRKFPMCKNEGIGYATYTTLALLRFGVGVENSLNEGMKFYKCLGLSDEEKRAQLITNIIPNLSFEITEVMKVYNDKQKLLFFEKYLEDHTKNKVVESFLFWLRQKKHKTFTQENSERRMVHKTVPPTAFTQPVKPWEQERNAISGGSSPVPFKRSKSQLFLTNKRTPSPRFLEGKVAQNVDYSKKSYNPSKEQTDLIVKVQSFSRAFMIRLQFGFSNLQQRKETIKELVETEKSLLVKMKLLDDLFRKPLMAIGVDSQVIKQLFLNLPQCILALEKVVEKMKSFEEFKYTSCISKVMNDILPHLTPLLLFASDYENAVNVWKTHLTEQKFKTIVTNARNSGELGLEKFETLFIQPVQRITRYALLLKQVKKTTPPKHPDFIPLVKTLVRFEKFCEEANKRTERRLSLLDLSKQTNLDIVVPNRLLLFSAQIGSKKKRMVHIMNDLVIVVKFEKKAGSWTLVTYFQLSDECFVSMKENVLVLEKHGKQQPISIPLSNKNDTQIAKNHILSLLTQHAFNLSNESTPFPLPIA